MGGFFSETTIAQVQSASDIVEVIGAVVPLKRAGVNFVGLCPFHKEKSPSFNVSPQKQAFYCFGCHKGGTVFTFLQQYENLTFPEAVRRLAERAHIPLETEDRPGAREERSLREKLLEIHEQLTVRWHHALLNESAGNAAREYLAKRQVPDEALKQFRLGFAPEAWDDTINWGRSKGHNPEILEKAGLILRKEGGGFYDRFRGRLMFPIADEQGRVIGFSGRVLDPEAKTAKYVNSPETPLFTKGKVIFGLDKAKRALVEAEFAVVCEGQLDLIACHMAGVQNVVAPQGTALTGDHIRILRRYVDEVVLCFDADNAGQNATVRSLDELLASGMHIRVAQVPAPHDPDSFIKEKGAAAFSAIVDSAPGFFDFYLNQLCVRNDVSSDRGKMEVVERMAEAVLKTQNPVLIDTYARTTALKLVVPPDAVRAYFKPRGQRERPPALDSDEALVTESASARPNQTEVWLLKFVFNDESVVEWISDHLDPQWIDNPAVRSIIGARILAHRQGTWNGPAGFMDTIEDVAAKNLLAEMLCDSRPLPNAMENLRGGPGKTGTVERLRNVFLDKAITQKTAEAAQPQLSRDDSERITGELMELKRVRRQPLAPLHSHDAQNV